MKQVVRARLLGPFAVYLGDKCGGPWPRLSAKRLLALVLLTPKRRMSREVASDTLFRDLTPGLLRLPFTTPSHQLDRCWAAWVGRARWCLAPIALIFTFHRLLRSTSSATKRRSTMLWGCRLGFGATTLWPMRYPKMAFC